MTVLPPGLIAPPEHRGTVAVVDRSTAIVAAAPDSSEPRWSVRSVAFVLLVAFTFVVFGITLADVTNG